MFSAGTADSAAYVGLLAGSRTIMIVSPDGVEDAWATGEAAKYIPAHGQTRSAAAVGKSPMTGFAL